MEPEPSPEPDGHPDPDTAIERARDVPPTVGEKWWLATGMATGVVGAVLPAMAVTWFAFTVTVWIVLAELLQRTWGLTLHVYEPSMRTAWIVSLATLLVGVLGFWRARPFAWMFRTHVLAVVLVLVLVPIDLNGFDVHDRLTATLLLLLGVSSSVLLPLVALFGLAWTTRATWRLATQTWVRAHRVASMGVSMGAAGGLTLGGLLALGAPVDKVSEIFTSDEEPFRDDLVLMSAIIPGGPAVPGYEVSYTHTEAKEKETRQGPIHINDFQACADELTKARADKESALQSARRYMERSWKVSGDEAYDAAMDALLRVCERYARGNFVRDLRSYFFNATKKRWLNRLRTRTRARKGADEWRRRRTGFDTEEGFSEADLQRVRQAKAELKGHEKLVLRMRYEQGLDYRRIGRLLDRTEAAARKRGNRATQALRKQFNRLANLD